jgi:hypothetical protein
MDQPRTEDFGRKCLLARRLLERGVRFVQVWSGNDNGFPRRNWDSHEDVERDHGPLARGMARGASALIQDLKQRGLLDDTLIVWGGEFGRTIYSQGALTETNYGRDHHPRCFSMFMAGAGVKKGMTFGETDDFSYNIVKDPVHVHDLNATIMHLLGVEHERLTYRFQGRDYRLTDIHGNVVKQVLA